MSAAPVPMVGTSRFAPPPPPAAVARPRLVDAIDHAADSPLTVVSAPAGFGKTVVLSEWFTRTTWTGRRVWITLDETVTAERLWRQIADRLAGSGEGRPSGVAGHGRPSGVDDNGHAPGADGVDLAPESIRDLPPYLVERILALPAPAAIVLDDLHVVRDPAILRGIQGLVHGLGERLRLLIGSRNEPDLGLPRLRAHGLVSEITTLDLVFTVEESAEFLRAAELADSSSVIAAIHQRTGGWVAALRLLGMGTARTRESSHLSGSSDVITGFDASRGRLADYLLDDVLSGLDPSELDFLMRISTVARVTPDLAARLAGVSVPEADELLHRLHRSWFLVRRADGFWELFHDLLAGTLGDLLEIRDPGAARRLDGVAATWFDEQGDGAGALLHARRAEDWALLAAILDRRWLTTLLRGDYGLVRDIVLSTPPEHHTATFGLAAAASVSIIRADADDVAHSFHEVATRFEDSSEMASEQSQVILRAVDLALDRFAGRVRSVIERTPPFVEAMARGSAEGANPTATALEGVFGNQLGESQLWIGDRRAVTTLRHGLEACVASGVEVYEAESRGALAMALQAVGDVEAASEVLAPLSDDFAMTWYAVSFHAVLPMLACSASAQYRGDLDAARRWLERADGALRSTTEPQYHLASGVARSSVLLASGAIESAWLEVRQARHWLGSSPEMVAMTPVVDRMAAEIALRRGDLDHAADLVGSSAEMVPMPWYTTATRVRLALMRRHHREAIHLADAQLDGALIDSRTALDLLVLKAVANERVGEPVVAAGTMLAAAERAERRGLYSLILDQPRDIGADALAILRRAPTSDAPAGNAPPGMSRLVTMLAERLRGAAPLDLAPVLTPREAAAVALLPSLMTITEIAEHLHVARNTVKNQLKSAYRKLGVSSRREAVEAARSFGLL